MKVNTSDAHKAGVSERVRQLLAERDNPLPVWVRAPKHGHEHYCGFSRAKLYEAAAKGHFRSVSIREPGQVKGTRLFHLGSILASVYFISGRFLHLSRGAKLAPSRERKSVR
jgi:hypothetical protein